MGGLDPIERPLAKVGNQVARQVPVVVLDRRALALLDLGQLLNVALTRLGDGLALRPRDRKRLCLHAAPQLSLGLAARQALARAGCPLGTQRALDAPAPGTPPAVPGLGSGGVRAGGQRAAAIGAPGHLSAPPGR